MANDDWAVVVGIKSYPAFPPLDGPENDAKAFYNWLVSPTGGAVPSNHVELILSPQPPASIATDAKPTPEQIEEAFDRLDDIADANNGSVGRRLYLYFAGHGFAPEFDAAILMANATRRRTLRHIPGKKYADWFFRSGYFKEVVLFMDCCQETTGTTLRPVHFNDVTSVGTINESNRFYGYGAKWSQLAQERLMDDGKVHGVFTYALLQALSGNAAGPDGKITATSLGDWLHNNMSKLLSPEAIANDEISKKPQLDYDKDPDNSFVFTTVQNVPQFTVNFHVPPTAANQMLRILDNELNVHSTVTAVSPVTAVPLPRNLYLADVMAANLSKRFEVTGLGDEDVHF